MPTREIRDPIHVFVRMDEHLRAVLDTRPVQRLRHIHQLALSYLVYPGATHRRFEHSLGVAELAGRVFDVITEPENVSEEMRGELPQLRDQPTLRAYWRRALQAAALLHDVGHVPFSHAAERLLPGNATHETMSRLLIESQEMRNAWAPLRPLIDPGDVVKLALGKKKAPDLEFSLWESILSEVIVGDAFGVDRMDYLLRDSLHMGVAYGRFDHSRLIDSLRILPSAPTGGEDGGHETREPTLGVDIGGLQSAEALLMARYFMYSQVYFHHVRLVLDLHLIDFLTAWLPGQEFPLDPDEHLKLTDNEVMQALVPAAYDPGLPGADPAERLIRRKHFRVLKEILPDDRARNAEAGVLIERAAIEQFGEKQVKHKRLLDEGGSIDFPVRTREGAVASSLALSDVLSKLPPVRPEFVFIAPEVREEATAWLAGAQADIMQGGLDGQD